MSIDTLRSQEIFPAHEYDDGITIIGAGAIGSKVWSILVELGLTNLQVFDFDKVEGHNINNQLYVPEDIGDLKVNALKRWTEGKWGGTQLPDTMQFHHYRFDPLDPDHLNMVEGTLFLLVDSLEARRNIASAFRFNYDLARIIDVRMAAQHGVVHNLDPHLHLDTYLDTLGNDDDAEVSACGSPFSVSYTGWALAGLAVSQHVNNCVSPTGADNIINLYLNPAILTTHVHKKPS